MNPHIFWLTPDRFDIKPDKSTWLEMARCLRESHWSVEIVTSCANEKTASTYDGIVHYVRAIDKPLLFRITTLLNALRHLYSKSKPGDIFIVNEDSLWLMPIFRLMGRRHIHLDIRTFPIVLLQFKQRLNRLLFWTLPIKLFARSADSFSFITERLTDAFNNEFQMDLTPRCTWESGVNMALFKDDEIPVKSADNAEMVLFYHGSLYLSRGIAQVLEAMQPFKESASVRLRIVGDGEEIAILKKAAEDLGVEPLIEFRGFVPYEQVVDEIRNADVCICPLPDRPEWNMSSPLKVLEYMALKKPVILTPIPAHKDMVGDADFVVWAEGADPPSLSRAIAQAFANREALNQAAQKGPDRVRGRYEWSRHARVLAELLKPTSTGQG